MAIKIITSAVVGAVLLFTAGCSFIPEYSQPEMPVADAWTDKGLESDTGSEPVAADIVYQDYFTSQTLQQIIAMALENNRDLKVALLNIEQAKAAYQIKKSDQLPVIAGSAGLSREGVPEDSSIYGEAYTSDTSMSVGLGITAYELDFFGRVKSLSQSALETYLATREAASSTRIALVAQTADAYVSLLAQRKLTHLAQETYKAQKATYDVIKTQYDAGSTDQLALAQAATSTESAKASIYQYKRLAAQAENALVYLAGPGVYELIKAPETPFESIDDIGFLTRLPAGLPSRILLARPDIQAAEHQLKAANADIGAARAAMYPTISLTGSLGFAAESLSYMFDPSRSLSWGFSPNVTIPIFNRKGLKANLAVATVGEKIAAAQYEGAIQTAFREVADQLVARRHYKGQLDAQNALVSASRNAYNLSKARYDNGIDDFLSVLDSQRSLFGAEQGAIALKQAYLSNLINLYKVMGGGRMDTSAAN
ncbi:multidrug transporter [Desulfobacter hydrogenophilus]|uniref:Efflux transporter outer membrane subunit n=1 Tax=Desulfobacter hydrogenophilus TaxID=2291 RepID=A0A328FAE8_9BACT|nr:efflux transporter outer membrane subunit [Desulfobacter hydrogenophilus]NDY71395.1 efflux transporter outer membrane subunit [Desulfobacter hydrogenophilus]QBH12135.1 efflux transporter outer membrane subunit [Desulfobacter hydrogenophilus]RAM00053.1 multidrug transporter [Desulfobacter hydrogenophilus]